MQRRCAQCGISPQRIGAHLGAIAGIPDHRYDLRGPNIIVRREGGIVEDSELKLSNFGYFTVKERAARPVGIPVTANPMRSRCGGW